MALHHGANTGTAIFLPVYLSASDSKHTALKRKILVASKTALHDYCVDKSPAVGEDDTQSRGGQSNYIIEFALGTAWLLLRFGLTAF